MQTWVVVALLIVAACGDNQPEVQGTELVALPAEITNQLDLLVVMGNEPNTADFQGSFAAAYPSLLNQISIEGAAPDLHVVTITPDLGTSSRTADPAPAIPGSVGGCFDTGDAGRPRTGAVPAAFHVGSTGCFLQQPLAAISAALANPQNADFRRERAALGIIVIADEDDCSALEPDLFSADASSYGTRSHFRCTQFGVTCDQADLTTDGPRTGCKPDHASTLLADPADAVTAVLAQVSDRRRTSVGAILGPSGPNDLVVASRAPTGSSPPIPAAAFSCMWPNPGNALDVADPAIRIAWFVDQFGDRGAIGSICDADQMPAAAALGVNLRRAMGDPCIEQDVPLDHCTAVDELDGVATQLPACDAATSTNCFELATAPATCPNAAHRELVVHRDAPPAIGTYALLRCT